MEKYNKEEQLELIYSIYEQEVDDLTITKNLRRLVQESVTAKDFVISFLLDKKDRKKLGLFLLNEEEFSTLSAPPKDKSACKWTKTELDYYNIQILNCSDESEIIAMKDVDVQAKTFIEKYGNTSLPSLYLKNIIEMDEFERLCYLAIKESKVEARIDTLFYHFLRAILPQKLFQILNHHAFDLIVNKIEKSTIPDLSVLFIPKLIRGVIVCEDKALEAEGLNLKNAEAQVIAEAIAVAQQERWPKDCPVFFFRIIGQGVTIYKAIFSQIFLNCVRNGLKGIASTIVKKLYRKDDFNNEGYNLIDPKDRKKLSEIIYSIGVEINEFKWN